MPSRHTPLETKDATYYVFSTDPLAGTVTYSTDQHVPANLVTLTATRAFEVISMNRRGEKPIALEGNPTADPEIGYQTGHGEITRFDRKKKKNHRK